MGNICSGAKTEANRTSALDPATDRTFHFRLSSKHDGSTTIDLTVDALIDGKWERQTASFQMPGFRQYLVSLVVCQHYYLVANARERNVPLKTIDGDITITTGKDWIVKCFEGDFCLKLDAPKDKWTSVAPKNALEYCKERMKLCPVSKNLPPGTDKQIQVRLAEY